MTRKSPRDILRPDIVEAALQEFLKRGYESTSLDAIARRAQLTKGGLYYHFRNKEEILLAVHQQYLESICVIIEDLDKTSNPVQALRFYIRRLLKHYAAHPREVTFWLQSLSKTMTHSGSETDWDYYISYVLDWIAGCYRRGFKDGHFRRHDPESRAVALLTAMEGMAGYVALSQIFTWKKAAAHFERIFIDEMRLGNSSVPKKRR